MADLMVFGAEGLTTPLVLFGVRFENETLTAFSSIVGASIPARTVLQACVLRAGSEQNPIFDVDPNGVRVITSEALEPLSELTELVPTWDNLFRVVKFKILKEGINNE